MECSPSRNPSGKSPLHRIAGNHRSSRAPRSWPEGRSGGRLPASPRWGNAADSKQASKAVETFQTAGRRFLRPRPITGTFTTTHPNLMSLKPVENESRWPSSLLFGAGVIAGVCLPLR